MRETTTGQTTTNAQVHTIEGFAAAFLIIGALIFALEATALTSGSASTTSQEVMLHNSKLTDSVLATSESTGELQRAILNWNESAGSNGGFEDGLERSDVPLVYGGTRARVPGYLELNETLKVMNRRGIVYNIDIVCDGDEHPFVFNGEPTLNAVTGSVTVVLYDDMTLMNSSSDTLGNTANYPCDDVSEDTNLYNVVEVKMTAWRG